MTTVAYLLLALEIVLDKFLLSSRRVSHPAVYAFYSATLGIFAFALFPFGFHLIGFSAFALRTLGGVIFVFGLLSLFFALKKSEASRVTPVVGAVVPSVIFFLSLIFLGERLGEKGVFGVFLLILGGLLISYDFSEKRTSRFFAGFYWSILSGILLAICATMFKGFYHQDNFFNVYIWTRLGAFLGSMTFFLVPSWRRKILSSIFNFKKPRRKHRHSGLLFILTKATGGTGSFLKEKATSLVFASVTVVNALVAVEYLFVFILSIVFSLWMPGIFEEKRDWKNSFQKISAIIVIAGGVFFVFSR